MKDKKWLKEKVREIARRVGDEHLYINIDTMLELIDQLDEPEVLLQDLPVIPKYVAEWIEALKSKEINMLESIYDFIHEEDINDYMREQSNVLMRAWLDGYTVESEQKYYAKIKGHELLSDREDSYWNVDRKELYIDNIWHDYLGYKTTKLTKYDWNNLGINEDNADFVKAEELEE